MNPLRSALEKVVEGSHLTEEEAEEVMDYLISGRASPLQMASFLTALRMKGETVEELSAFARVMREHSLRIHPSVGGRLVDTCGTGGDRIKTFNISTTAMFVAAGAGVPIAKHGNRSVTSRAGSADVVEALGAVIELPPEQVRRCIEEVGVGFMFAPLFHPAMKHASPVRREMGIRTVFNVLGPLTNPAGAKGQVVGVFEEGLTEKLARVLGRLGCERALVVYGRDGLDELSTLGETKVSELVDGEVLTYTLTPEELGMDRARAEELVGGDAAENARMLVRILSGEERGPRREVVLMNAAAALLVGGKVLDLREGVERASEAVDSGKALEKLREFVRATGGDPGRVRELGGGG
jgi:anthranilate phosphoribosyltransferase